MSTLNLKPSFTVAFRGKMFEILHWEGKPGVTFEAAARAPGVRLLIETEKDGVKALLMTREIRRETEGYDFRLPGGKVFDTLDALDTHRDSAADIAPLALAAAKNEGQQEAGISGGEYTLIDISKAGASVEWDLHYYKVTGATIGSQQLDEEEVGDIETVTLSALEIFEKLIKREVKEGRSADVLWSWLAENGFIEFKK